MPATIIGTCTIVNPQFFRTEVLTKQSTNFAEPSVEDNVEPPSLPRKPHGKTRDGHAGNIRYCFDSYQSGVYSGSFEADVREWSHAVRDVAVTDDAETVSQSLTSLGPAGSKVTADSRLTLDAATYVESSL